MEKEQVLDRLRTWAARAAHEAQEADTPESRRRWQGEAAVLSGVASFLADEASQADDMQILAQVVANREQALANMLALRGTLQAATHAGEVSGYDIALTVLKDAAGKTWPRIVQYTQ